MDASATPAIIAVGAVLTGILLAPRALDAPPPVVQEAPIDDDARASIIDVEKTVMGAWRLTVHADGTAMFAARDRKNPAQDLMLVGPIDPALVSQVQALRRPGGPILMTKHHHCIVSGAMTAWDWYASNAPEHHEEAAGLVGPILHDLELKHELARRHELAAVVRPVGQQPRAGATYEVTEILYVADGIDAPQTGATFVLRDDGAPAPAAERLLAYRDGDAWSVAHHDAEEARRLAWLGAHPPLLVEAQTGLPGRRAR